MNQMTINEKLAVNKFEIDEGCPHIEVDNQKCKAECGDKFCLFICPAEVYQEQNGMIIPEYAACLECGTCVAACPSDALHWVYPRGGFGVNYRHG